MSNPKLNVDEVVRCFPGQVESDRGFPVFNLDSPFDIALRENQLRIVRDALDLGRTVPAHYLVYAQGEPDTREQSRIGGLPYRPRELAWPRDTNGRPKEFVCQIDFSDSRSLLPALPGDIMLLFASEEGLDENPFKLEWYPVGLTDLMGVGDLPRLDFTFPMVIHESVFCYLYQTHDFPEAEARIKGTRFEAWRSFGVPCGSKIAGFNEAATESIDHIFTLESIRLIVGDPFPFVNRRDWEPESIIGRLFKQFTGAFRTTSSKRARNRCYDILMIGDLGRIRIFKEADQFRVSGKSY